MRRDLNLYRKSMERVIVVYTLIRILMVTCSSCIVSYTDFIALVPPDTGGTSAIKSV